MRSENFLTEVLAIFSLSATGMRVVSKPPRPSSSPTGRAPGFGGVYFTRASSFFARWSRS
jgi:hypothetical protein